MRGARRSLLAVAAGFALLIISTVSAASVLAQPISSDPYTDSPAQHQTQVEPDSFAYGSTIVAVTQSGRINNGGASNIVYSSSRDSGRTWTTGGLPGTTVNEGGPWPRISDPSIAYDPQDNVWLALGLGIDQGGSGHILLVNRSTDGGLTWSNPVTAGESTGSFWDKTWITCDTWASSPFYGNCYIQYDDNGQGNAMKMVTSTDGGVTWGPIRSPPGCSSGLGGQPVVQPTGTVIVPYSNNYSAISSFLSTDGGNSWSDCTFVSGVNRHVVNANMRAYPMPSAEVAGDGRVYAAWHDCRFRMNCLANDIVYSTSMDGLTWSVPTRVPIDAIDSNIDHFLPGIAVDKSTSGGSTHLALGYYYFPVSTCSGESCDLTFGFVSSLDGGATWSPAKRVHGPMKPSWVANSSQGRMVGDYISTSFTGDGKAHPVFSMAKASIGTAFRQQLGQATFDITTPPIASPILARKDKVLYQPRSRHRRPNAAGPTAD